MMGLFKKKPKPPIRRAQCIVTVHIDNGETVEFQITSRDIEGIAEDIFLTAEEHLNANCDQASSGICRGGIGTGDGHYPPHRITKITYGPITVTEETQ